MDRTYDRSNRESTRGRTRKNAAYNIFYTIFSGLGLGLGFGSRVFRSHALHTNFNPQWLKSKCMSWTWIGSIHGLDWIGSEDCNPLFFFHLYIFYINNLQTLTL